MTEPKRLDVITELGLAHECALSQDLDSFKLVLNSLVTEFLSISLEDQIKKINKIDMQFLCNALEIFPAEQFSTLSHSFFLFIRKLYERDQIDLVKQLISYFEAAPVSLISALLLIAKGCNAYWATQGSEEEIRENQVKKREWDNLVKKNLGYVEKLKKAGLLLELSEREKFQAYLDEINDMIRLSGMWRYMPPAAFGIKVKKKGDIPDDTFMAFEGLVRLLGTGYGTPSEISFLFDKFEIDIRPDTVKHWNQRRDSI